MKFFLLVLTTVLFLSCRVTREPLSTAPPSNNKTYEVDYLFEHEGCKVYRFYDLGNYVYFTNCRGEAIVKTDSTEIRNKIELTKH